jgi:hypothetical protein
LIAISTACAVGAAIALGIENLLPGLHGLLIAAILSVTVIASLLWSLDRRFALGIVGNLPRFFPQISALIRLVSADR